MRQNAGFLDTRQSRKEQDVSTPESLGGMNKKTCIDIFFFKYITSFPNDNISDWSKFDENGRKFNKRVENTVGKG